MLVNICVKFNEDSLKVFLSYRADRLNHKIFYIQFQRALTPKIDHPKLWILRSAYCLMLVNICVKIREDI